MTKPTMPGGGAYGRSARREVRNPVLALPSISLILNLPPEQRAVLCALLRDLSADAKCKAQAAWIGNKGIMAAYWKAVSVYSLHLARVINPARTPTPAVRNEDA
ncbi:hypothetical protein [Niveispirillum sp.]|uniref:hypothetical protein n=1 Tax=Niveispirillum sp. TaxID=1917217 RepID=UPI001B65B7BB|nr:hypothetical protein [Niveispirillum sp.]MBP7337673.1 hypothetical protein [Niveispirillum sp.]